MINLSIFSPKSIWCFQSYHSVPQYPYDDTHPPLTETEIYNGSSRSPEINGSIIGFPVLYPAINSIHQKEKRYPIYEIQGRV